MSSPSTIHEILQAGDDDAVALSGVGRDPLTYARLRDLATITVSTLNGFGIGRNDRVAIVLPNGPEMATAFVSIACGATTAPLNPAYKLDEFNFYLSDLDARALVVEKGSESAAVEAARQRNIRILYLCANDETPAGAFSLESEDDGTSVEAVDGGMANADDVALVLHTSGTTSRPKIVPLKQSNVCASAGNIQKTLHLDASDVCLNVNAAIPHSWAGWQRFSRLLEKGAFCLRGHQDSTR